jgi:hypothetical protein
MVMKDLINRILEDIGLEKMDIADEDVSEEYTASKMAQLQKDGE